MDTFLKYYLPFYLLLYMTLAFVIPTYRTWKSTGINPVTFGKTDTAHNYLGFVMKLLIGLLFVTVLCFSLSAQVYKYFIPVYFLDKYILKIAGLILIHASLVWIAVAQKQMSDSWRIGIDEVNKTDLRTTRIFGLSRNPVFLGMIISAIGLFLVIPNVMTFFIWPTTYIVLQIQIRLEEVFLENQHGDIYMNYKMKTRRLL